MIEAILNDAQAAGAIRSWHVERRLMFPKTLIALIVHYNDGTAERRTAQRATDFCVGLAIGLGHIPDPDKPLYAWAYHR